MELPIVRAYQCDERDVEQHQLQGRLALGGDGIQGACPASKLSNLDRVEIKGAGKCDICKMKLPMFKGLPLSQTATLCMKTQITPPTY